MFPPRRRSVTLSTRLFAIAILAALPTLLLVAARAVSDAAMDPVERAAAHALWRDLLLIVTFVALDIGIVWMAVTRLVARPLEAVGEAAQRLAAGDFSARVTLKDLSPEVETTVFAFNEMAEALEARSRLFTALAERSPDGIARLAADGTILYVNSALECLLDVPSGTMVGRTADACVPAALAAEWRAMSTDAAGTPPGPAPATGSDSRDVAVSDEGTSRILEVRMVAERDDAGVPVAFLTIIRDVTEARMTSDALRQAQKLESVGQLAGGIAHDFNNLLTGLVGHADLALDQLDPDHPARHDVQALRDAALRSTGMTRQLLTFARKQVTLLAPHDVSTVVSEVKELLGRLIGPAVRLEYDLGPALPMVDLDRSQLEQVLVNLSVNARDAMPHGGTLRVRTRTTDVDEAHATRLGLAAPGAYVTLDVEDTGTGMPPHVVSRIFEPFFTTKAPDKGTGLGLSTCYAIARDHGGVLTVTSHVGVGSRFSLYLPASAQAATPADGAPDPWRDSVAGGRESILLVEDDDPLRSLLARVLRSRGYQVTEVSDGAQALRLATTAGAPPFDILVSDVRTPRLGGAALATQLERARPGQPMLFFTGHPDDLDPDGRLLGRTVLAKPFTAVQLLHAVRERLDAAGAAEAISDR